MITRLKFAFITGLMGLVAGVIVAFAIQGKGEEFPVFVILPFVTLFALGGALAKKDWADRVIGFFWDVLP